MPSQDYTMHSFQICTVMEAYQLPWKRQRLRALNVGILKAQIYIRPHLGHSILRPFVVLIEWDAEGMGICLFVMKEP